ncbi:hypothetical protein N332_00039, partial [Mesitornis unicolor]
VNKPIHGKDQSDTFSGQASRAQCSHHGDKSGMGDACSPDAACYSCDT